MSPIKIKTRTQARETKDLQLFEIDNGSCTDFEGSQLRIQTRAQYNDESKLYEIDHQSPLMEFMKNISNIQIRKATPRFEMKPVMMHKATPVAATRTSLSPTVRKPPTPAFRKEETIVPKTKQLNNQVPEPRVLRSRK